MLSSSKILVKSSSSVSNLKSNTILVSEVILNSSLFFKRSLSFEQKLVNVVKSGHINNLNKITYDLIFDFNPQNKGFLTNLADKTIQSLPRHMYSYKKALNPISFFNDNPHLNITINTKDFSVIQQLNQRTNGICEIMVAKSLEQRYNEHIILTHGNISNPTLSYKQTGQQNSDYICAKVLHNGQIYYYYNDLKISDKTVFLNNISKLHPSKLVLCQVHYVGGLTENYVFDTFTKNKLIQGCDEYMLKHIADNTAISQYQSQFYSELSYFDSNPSVFNYNSLTHAPWRIVTTPILKTILNA